MTLNWHGNAVKIADGANLDAFSRQRVSEPITLVAGKHIHGDLSDIFDYFTTGAPAVHTYNAASSTVDLNVGTTSGQKSTKQSRRYIGYNPGNPQFIAMSFVFGAAKANLLRELGYGDASDGIFMRQTSAGLSILQRSSTSGSVVEIEISQANWNLDTFDGSKDENNPSGFSGDETKANILIIDLQWLGVGRVRVGFDIDGVITYAHEFLNANMYDVPYMSTGSLPMRWHIENTGTTASASIFRTICGTVQSEGSFRQAGESIAASNKAVLRAVTTRVPVLALRPTATLNGKINRKTLRLKDIEVFSQDENCFFELVHAHGVTGITGTWVAVAADSGLDVSTDVTAVTSTSEDFFVGAYAVAGGVGRGASSGSASKGIDVIDEHAIMELNHAGTADTIFVVYATSIPGATTNVSVTLVISEQD